MDDDYDFALEDIEVIRLTDKAMLIEHDDLGEVWLPISQVECGDEIEEGYTGELRVKEWLAKSNGWC